MHTMTEWRQVKVGEMPSAKRQRGRSTTLRLSSSCPNFTYRRACNYNRLLKTKSAACISDFPLKQGANLHVTGFSAYTPMTANRYFSANVRRFMNVKNLKTRDPISTAVQQLTTSAVVQSKALSKLPDLAQPKTSTIATQSSRPYTCKCGCGCPFPCGPFGCCKGCGCLPPPCNTPPRCIQYMTGYYYYPYGFWFCGPYHVTGLCCPVSGSCPCGCGCGCGCGKCCACCVCPDIAGAALAAGIPALAPTTPAPKRVFQTQLGKGFSIQEKKAKDTASRISMNKFFPFSTTVTPSIHSKPSAKKIMQGAFIDKKRGFKIPDKRAGPTRSYSTVRNYNKVYVRFGKRDPYSASMKPRKIPTTEEREQPNIYPRQFHSSSFPNLKNPYNHKSWDEFQNAIKVDS